MKCRVCASALFPGRAVFHCQCVALTHCYCWEQHVLDSHQPAFAVGTITLSGEFRPNVPDGQKGNHEVGRELITDKRVEESGVAARENGT